MPIRYLTSEQIDKVQWDACIETSKDRHIYAFSWYLDHMAEYWGGLVLNDYEAVMPLPYKIKWGFHYVYTPFFMQQLGVFSREKLYEPFEIDFLRSIPLKFVKVHTTLHAGSTLIEKSYVKKRRNYILNLQSDFETIRKGFKPDVLSYVRKQDLHVQENVSYEQIIDFYKSQYQAKHRNIEENDYMRLLQLCHLLQQKEALYTVGCFVDGQMIGALLFLNYAHKLVLLISASNINGKKKKVSYKLMYHVIKAHSGNDLIFDFEGSEIPEVASFFRKFGPIETHYGVLEQKIWERFGGL